MNTNNCIKCGSPIPENEIICMSCYIEQTEEEPEVKDE